MSMHKTKVGASKMGTVKTGGNPRDGIAQKGPTRAAGGGMAKMMAAGGKAKMMAGGGMSKMMKSGGRV